MTEQRRDRASVVVVGGGYAGITVAKKLDDVAAVTLVDPTEAFTHNVAAWRTLVAPEWVERMFHPYDRLLRHGRFVRDRAVAVDGRQVTLASGERLEPDYLVLATGSTYPFPAKIDEPDLATAQARLRRAHADLLAADRVLLLGAGAAGLELAGEIKTFFPEKHVTVVDAGPDILPGPYDQELREELRRQLDKLGVDLRLDTRLRGLPTTEPAVRGAVAVTTEDGEELTADIWYRCFGVAPVTDYVVGALAQARDERGYLRVDEYLRVDGQDRVFAVGDLSTADLNMAARAGAQAELVAANLRCLITGAGDVSAYQPMPPVIIVPLGPEGGAGLLPGMAEGVAGPEVAAEIKGRTMLVDRYLEMFDAEPAARRR
ncbi:FAD-dependent oxidoreductase [Micromonospora sp. HM5-17]|jgi:NADH dehydrogenase FAD-containing subunit|uniref:FAD-dependent oxidoreductase n=1 Tax=Micromonospora sp. HM5-17 TaxID=2487710 RepID=UPI000F48F91F|nr:FAD-dependent oxidoreductase [Micromonospora sp. HM5-17]ROT34054.1 FAD-dependent oxidoreductase [Micromonospora sp. HM5-17]